MEDTWKPIEEAISMRDRAALAALPVVIDKLADSTSSLFNVTECDRMARAAYRVADSMIKAREGK